MRLQSVALSLTCIFLATTLANSSAQAGVYKIVGPDGKISFSDKPPADAATTDKIDVIRTQTAPLSSPAATSATASSTTDAKAAQKSGAKQATPVPSQSNAAIANPDPAIEKAIIGVLGYEDLVKQTAELCVRTLPTSYQKYSGAADGWRSRNAAVVAQAHRVLAAQFNPSQRQAIEAAVRQKNNSALAPVEGAATASKISWCDSSGDAIKDGTMDVFNKPNLSAPLMKSGS